MTKLFSYKSSHKLTQKLDFKFWSQRNRNLRIFETGTSENTRILRVFLRIVRTCHPITRTSDLFLFSNVIHHYSLVFLALPVPSPSLTSPPPSLSPKPQDLPFQVDSKAKGTSIGMENHPSHSFLLGVAPVQALGARVVYSGYTS